jgi:hypothetical protein
VLSIRQWWFDRAGWCRIDSIRENPGAVAAYIAKYGGKSGAFPPMVYGFGLLERESFSMRLGIDRRAAVKRGEADLEGSETLKIVPASMPGRRRRP